MSFIIPKTSIEVKVKKKDKRFTYIIKDNDKEKFRESTTKAPSLLGERSNLGQYLINLIKEEINVDYSNPSLLNTKSKEIFSECKVKLNRELNNVDKQIKKKREEAEKLKNEKYNNYASQLIVDCRTNHITLLGYLAEITKGLGVGNYLEIMKAYMGFFQTISGSRGINVIMIGDSGQGKSYTIAPAIGMCPQEYIYKGELTLSAFMGTFAGKDVTGMVFDLGDLGGGQKDDENTIELRNVLKRLISEGYFSRTITDKETGMQIQQTITGYPCLTYTTADEEIINDQEASRSFIGYPPVVNTRQLSTYNDIFDMTTDFTDNTYGKIKQDQRRFRGLIHTHIGAMEEYDIFNPYSYGIEDWIHKNKNFNRKIKEFKSLLKVVTLLDDPKMIENGSGKKIMICSKQDNINALTLFDTGSGALPTDIMLANGLKSSFKTYMSPLVGDDLSAYVEEAKDFIIPDDDQDYSIGSDQDYDTDYAFTIQDLKLRFQTKEWIQKNNKNLSEKLYKLTELGYLIRLAKIGKGRGRNVYILNPGFNFNANKYPLFKDIDVQLALKLFNSQYKNPELLEEIKEFVDDDFPKDIDSPSFNTGKCNLFELEWEKDDYIR